MAEKLAIVKNMAGGRVVYGYAWRVPTAYFPDGSVADVVLHETKELGNDIKFKGGLSKLKRIPAICCAWVCLNKKDAQRYGRNPVARMVGSWIIGEDGDGGYLIVADGVNLYGLFSE